MAAQLQRGVSDVIRARRQALLNGALIAFGLLAVTSSPYAPARATATETYRLTAPAHDRPGGRSRDPGLAKEAGPVTMPFS